MKVRQLTPDDIGFTSEVMGNNAYPNRVRAYGHLVGLSCVSHIIWVKENYNEAVVKAQMALALNMKLVEHLKKVKAFLCEPEPAWAPQETWVGGEGGDV